MKQCEQCQAPLLAETETCPECGQNQAASPDQPKSFQWERKPPLGADVTQFVEIPVGGFSAPPQPKTAESAPVPARPSLSPLLLAVCLGILAGLFVILVLFGMTRLQRAPIAPPGAASPHPAGQ